MQLTINIGDDQVFELVRQLSPRERKRLFLESEFIPATQQTPEPVAFDEEYYEFLMNFPVVSEEEIERILEAQKGLVDQNRRDALRLALECPLPRRKKLTAKTNSGNNSDAVPRNA